MATKSQVKCLRWSAGPFLRAKKAINAAAKFKWSPKNDEINLWPKR